MCLPLPHRCLPSDLLPLTLTNVVFLENCPDPVTRRSSRALFSLPVLLLIEGFALQGICSAHSLSHPHRLRLTLVYLPLPHPLCQASTVQSKVSIYPDLVPHHDTSLLTQLRLETALIEFWSFHEGQERWLKV